MRNKPSVPPKLPFSSRRTKYEVRSLDAFVHFFESRGVFEGRNRRGKGIEIIESVARNIYNDTVKIDSKKYRTVSVLDNELQYSVSSVLPIPTKAGSISDSWARKKNVTQKYLGYIQFNLILSLIFFDSSYTVRDIKRFLELVRPIDEDCENHFNYTMYVVMQLLQKNDKKLLYRYFLTDGKGTPTFKSELVKNRYEPSILKTDDIRDILRLSEESLIGSLIPYYQKGTKSRHVSKQLQALYFGKDITTETALQYYGKYRKKIADLTYFELVKNIDQFEGWVHTDIIGIIDSTFCNAGYVNDKGYFKKGSQIINFECTRDKYLGGDKLTIFIEKIGGQHNPYIEIPIEINQIGRIQKVCLVFPDLEMIDYGALLSNIRSLIVSAYICYENIYRENAMMINDRIFKGHYGIIRNRLVQVGMEHLIDKVFLLFAHGKEDIVLFFFDGYSLKKAIEHYKNVQEHGTLGKSPLELTIAITTRMFSFKKSVAIEAYRSRKAVDEYFSNVKYKDDDPFHFKAEYLLINSDLCTGYVPSIVRDHFLIIGCPTDYAEEILSEVKAVEGELSRQLEKIFKGFSLFIKNIENHLSNGI